MSSSTIAMEPYQIREIISITAEHTEPTIKILKRADASGSRIGVFASSFNPVTGAHLELMRLATQKFSLQETLALAGVANADKTTYESSLEERLTMLLLALRDAPTTAIGVSSHPYFVDIAEALRSQYTEDAEFFFTVGFDTFERVLDPDGKYTHLYHHGFKDRSAALKDLLQHSYLIVASRCGSTSLDVDRLLDKEPPEIKERVLHLDVPFDLAERSASEVREHVRSNQPITGLVPSPVERYIHEHGIYRDAQIHR